MEAVLIVNGIIVWALIFVVIEGASKRRARAERINDLHYYVAMEKYNYTQWAIKYKLMNDSLVQKRIEEYNEILLKIGQL